MEIIDYACLLKLIKKLYIIIILSLNIPGCQITRMNINILSWVIWVAVDSLRKKPLWLWVIFVSSDLLVLGLCSTPLCMICLGLPVSLRTGLTNQP